mmetsp:Transcript_66622/g.134304  ORF Transcript_66622/g.134304 Transcript_66622/m.134304 type:complete len:423 (+) Transcript_66622:153-1421(+)
MASTVGGGGTSAMATIGDTLPDGLAADPFQYNQSFPSPVEEWSVLQMHGLSEGASTIFNEIARVDGDVDAQGRPMLRREKLHALAASELHFALICQRPGWDVKDIVERMPHLLEVSDSRGHSPLHIAVMNGDPEVVSVLIAAGSPVNARTRVQNTPLHLCYDKPEMVALLVGAGSQIEVINKWQKTPLDWCRATLNAKTGPVGTSRKIMENATSDFSTQVERAKQQQIKVDTCRKLAAKSKAELEAAAQASLAAAEAFMAQFQEEQGGPAEGEGGGDYGGGDEEKWEEESTGVSSLQALAATKGAEFAQELYGGVKQAKGHEINRSKKDMQDTQKRMAEVGSTRGLYFNKFVSGNHGAREIDAAGVQRHNAHKAYIKEHGAELDEGDDSYDEEKEEGDDYDEDDEDDDGNSAYSSVTGGDLS